MNIEPVEKDNREGLNKVGPESKRGIYDEPRTEDFT